MSKLFIDRRAADNKYLHPDFHIAMDQGLRYLGERFGDNAVSDYLRIFAEVFYAPLIAESKARGFSAVRDHIINIYETEDVPDAVTVRISDDEMCVSVSACPAVMYMNRIGHTPSKWYIQTTSTVNEAISDALNWGFTLISYDEGNGAAEYRFFKRH